MQITIYSYLHERWGAPEPEDEQDATAEAKEDVIRADVKFPVISSVRNMNLMRMCQLKELSSALVNIMMLLKALFCPSKYYCKYCYFIKYI